MIFYFLSLLSVLLSFLRAEGEVFAMDTLQEGQLVPEWIALNQDKKEVRLSHFSQQKVLLYFYPKDDTPGCTVQACQLRDHFTLLKAKGLVILGVSAQGAVSHDHFRKKYQLPFDLLVDESGSLASLFSIGRIPVLHWIIPMTQRESVLLFPIPPQTSSKASFSATHFLQKRYRKVNPETHAAEVLRDVGSTPLSPSP